MHRRRGFGGVVRAARLQTERAHLAKGISDAMWTAIEDLHLARLERDRGRWAAIDNPTFVALWKRGLATFDRRTEDRVVWSLSPNGTALAKDGRP